ncbi:MAG: hypothetical protein M3N32_05140 [Actinomycetota bacterium]|nr:hypothetical protein [Actinomycetota bacterium]
MTALVLLAAESEGIPGSHIAAKLALPLGLLMFSGSVFVLLWSVYGAKKGALVYGTAFFAFSMMIGVFWWFGAPGTPVATGLQYFPYQESDRYQGKWYGMEPGSDRAEFFPVTNTLENLQTPAAYLGLEDVSPAELETRPAYRSLVGDLNTALGVMLELYLPQDEAGTPVIGQQRRRELRASAGAPQPGERPASPFFTARAKPADPNDPSQPILLVSEDRGLRVVGSLLQVVATYESTDPTGRPATREVVVEEEPFYAFKDPGALWFPSAVWTGLSALLFLGCLFGLDRVEQREKQMIAEREPVGLRA